MNIHWSIKIALYLIIGLVSLILATATVFNVFETNELTSDRIKTSFVLYVIAAVCLFPVYEAIRKYIYGKKTWNDIASEVLEHAVANLPKNPHEQKKDASDR